MRQDLTAERLRELLDYDPLTGDFFWRVSRRGRNGGLKKGDVAGSSREDGKIQIGIDQQIYLAHRLAWLHVHGKWPLDEIDHRDGLSNEISNLREATSSQNKSNRGPRVDNASGFKGVCWNKSKKKWQADIKAQGKKYYLGRFDDLQSAHGAYAAAAARLHGSFARAA